MNRKLVMTLAVSGALAGLAASADAREALNANGGTREIEQLVEKLNIALPLLVADGDEDKKGDKADLLADGDEDKKSEKADLIA